MPVTVAVAAVVSGAAGAATAAITGAAIGAAFLGSAITGAISAGLAYLMRPDDPGDDAGGGGAADLRRTVTAAVSPARWILGRARVGGVMFYAAEEDGDTSTLWMVQGIAEGPLDRVERIWIGDEEIAIDRTADGVITPQSSSRHAGNMTIWEVFAGDGDTSGAGPTALRTASGGEWTTAHQLNGIGYVVIRLHQPSDSALFSGIPNLNFLVRGLKFTWPGQSTPAWTDNAAACRYWYMRNRRDIPAAAFNEASVTEAITWCGGTVAVDRPSNAYAGWPATESRYTINGVVHSTDPVQRMEAAMDWAWQGYAVEFGGVFHFRPGKDRNAVGTISDSDILEVVACKPFPAMQDRANALSMSLRQSSLHDWVEYSVPEVEDAEVRARDGVRLARDLGQRAFIASAAAGDRILRMFLRRLRNTFRLTLRLSPRDDLRWIDLMPTDTVLVDHEQLGLRRWRAMVVSTTMQEDASIVAVLEDCPDGTYADHAGRGQLSRPYLRIPRRTAPPDAITGATATVSVRVSTDGAYFWRVVVQVPADPLGFAARLKAGDITMEERTGGASLEFDLDAPRTSMTVEVWRESAHGTEGPITTLAVRPEYTAAVIPAAALRDYRSQPGLLRVALADPKSRAVAGAEFRFRSVAVGSAEEPGAITALNWLDADLLDALPMVLTPGRQAVFNVVFPETARYRIAARYVDNVGRLGPVTDLGVFTLALPPADRTTVLGAPDWAGTSQHLAAVDHGAEVILLPDRDAISSLPRVNWDGYSDTNTPDKYQRRRKAGSGSFGSWTDEDADASSATISGLTNGTEYTFELRRVDGGTGGTAATVKATPRAAATAPPKPTGLTLTPAATSIALAAQVVEDSRAPVTRWEHRHRTTGGTWGSWTAITDSDDPSVAATITGLTASTAYEVQVRAVNSVGNGTASDGVTATTLASVSAPPKPSLTLTAPDSGTFLNFSATVSGNGGAAITSWQIRWATTQAGLSSATWGTVSGASGNSASGRIENLDSSTTYHVQVRAVNSAGNSPASDSQSAATPSSALFNGGSGTQADPYRIDDLADWSEFRNLTVPWNGGARIWIAFTLAQSRQVTVNFTASQFAQSIALRQPIGTVRAYSLSSESVTATLASGTGYIVILPNTVNSARMRITTAAAGAGGLSSLPDAPAPSAFTARKVAAAGIRATWSAPQDPAPGYALTGYQLEFRTTPSGSFTSWPGTLGPERDTITVPDGVGGDDAWRIRAVYDGGATGTAYSEWVEVSIADAFAEAAAASSGASPLALTATAGDGEVTLSWTDPNVRPESFWPWGECEGYNATFNAAASTWHKGELIDLGAVKAVSVSVEVEHYEPPLAASGAGGAASGAADGSPDSGPVFTGDLGLQVWQAGAAIPEIDLPQARSDQEIALRVDGLPRGVFLTDAGALSGTPSLAAGTEGVARITARTPDGLEDHSFFAWTIAAALAKSGSGTAAAPYQLGTSGPVIADIRDWILPGRTNAAALAAAAAGSATQAIPSYFATSTPAGEAWQFNLWDPDGGADSEDFDLIDYPDAASAESFHITTGGRERNESDNTAGAAARTGRVGVYVHATATDTDHVNANEEGVPAKPRVLISWSRAPLTGQALADAWDGYAAAAADAAAAAGGNAPGSESVTDIYVHHGTSAASLTKTLITGGTHSITARYVAIEVHLRKWRGRALRQITTQITEG